MNKELLDKVKELKVEYEQIINKVNSMDDEEAIEFFIIGNSVHHGLCRYFEAKLEILYIPELSSIITEMVTAYSNLRSYWCDTYSSLRSQEIPPTKIKSKTLTPRLELFDLIINKLNGN